MEILLKVNTKKENQMDTGCILGPMEVCMKDILNKV
jgi:hypothetical protein